MFDFKSRAEVRHLNVRTEAHGDEYVPAIDVKLMVLDVPITKLSTACPNLERFYEGDQVAVGEVNPLTVGHKIENVTVHLGDPALTMKGVTIKKGARLNLKPGRIADMLVAIQVEHHGDLAIKIMKLLREEVPVEFQERQLKLADMP